MSAISPNLTEKACFGSLYLILLLKKKDIKFTSEQSVHGLVMGECNAGTMSPSILLINLNWGLVRGAAFSTNKPPVP